MREALAAYLVIFLPEQQLSFDDLERITDPLGGRDATPFVTPVEGRPHVIRVIKEPGDQLNFANAWPSYLSYLPAPTPDPLLPALGGTRPRRRHGVGQPGTWRTRHRRPVSNGPSPG